MASEIIDRKAAANSLRLLADRLEMGDYRLTVMEHQVYAYLKQEWLSLKWEERR